MSNEIPDEIPDGLGAFLGVEGYEHPEDKLARAKLPVTPRIQQPYGIVHGGAYSTLAETITSRATWEAVGASKGAFGQTNDTSFLRAVREGTIHAEAVAKHCGNTTWVWEVEMRDDEGRLCAISRMTIAVRELRSLPPASS